MEEVRKRWNFKNKDKCKQYSIKAKNKHLDEVKKLREIGLQQLKERKEGKVSKKSRRRSKKHKSRF